MTLGDVRYVPGFKAQLFSVAAVTERGIDFEFGRNEVRVRDADGIKAFGCKKGEKADAWVRRKGTVGLTSWQGCWQDWGKRGPSNEPESGETDMRDS